MVGWFPDENVALMLACVYLCHVEGSQWDNKKYMNMKDMEVLLYSVSLEGGTSCRQSWQQICVRILTLPRAAMLITFRIGIIASH